MPTGTIRSGAAPATTSQVIETARTTISKAAFRRQARTNPRRVAIDSVPAARSRSTSARALAMASAAPARPADGRSGVNQLGSEPATPSHPKTGRSGIPTANGTHDQIVPFATRS
ncbi:MAG: hypothetical protein WKF78_02380 [Candidatus Limnocylindrales bacterium]